MHGVQEGGTPNSRRCRAQTIAGLLHRAALVGVPDAARQRADLDAIVTARVADGERCRAIVPSVLAAFWCLVADRLRDDVVTAVPAGIAVGSIGAASLTMGFEPGDVGVSSWVWLLHAVSCIVFAWALFDPEIDGNGKRFRIGAGLEAAMLVPLAAQVAPLSTLVWGLKASLAVVIVALALMAVSGWRHLHDSTRLAGVFATMTAVGAVAVVVSSDATVFRIAGSVITVMLTSLFWSAPRVARSAATRAVVAEQTNPATA